ncbi:MAG: hypothetical protein MJ239_06140 [Bacilli bacterium]|nr:hypothetical protein [Bacilli bacterium]
MKNLGFENEKTFVKAINGKKFADIPPIIQKMISSFWPDIREEEVLDCDLSNRFSKPDIVIWRVNKPLYVSIKSGSADWVHCESFRSFILFLREIGVSTNGQKAMLRFLYGDGTLIGSKNFVYPLEKYKELYKDEIASLNVELSDEVFLEKLLYRFIFRGKTGRTVTADYLYLGTIREGLFASRDEIISHIRKRPCAYIKVPHVSFLTFQPFSRNKRLKNKNDPKGLTVQVKWKHMFSDLERIRFS